MHERGPVRRPTRIGTARSLPWLVIAWLFAVTLLQWVPTQIIAAKANYNAWLGRPLFLGVYEPFAWVTWLIRYSQPVERLLRRPMTIFPPNYAAAFALLPWIEGAIVLLTMIGLAIAVVAIGRAAGDPRNLHDAGGKWHGKKEARELGLLGGLCGFILGALEEANDAPLRFGGQLSMTYEGPPGSGKSAIILTNLLFRLRHTDAYKNWRDYPWWWVRWLLALFIPSLRPWTAKRRRKHSWGEEPLILALDPKFDVTVKASGFQHRGLRKRVELFAPLGVPKDYPLFDDVTGEEIGRAPFPFKHEQLACFNPHWTTRLGSDRGFQDCFAKAIATVDAAGEGIKHHWDRTALDWGAAVQEHLGFVALNTGNYEMFSYPGLLDYLSSFRNMMGEDKNGNTIVVKTAMDCLIEEMLTYEHDRTGKFGWTRLQSDGSTIKTKTKPSIYGAAHRMTAKEIRERSAVFSTFIAMLSLYNSDALRRYIMRSTFEPKQMANDPKRSSFVGLGAHAIELPELQPFLRSVTEAWLREFTEDGNPVIDGQSVRPNKYPFILFMDEAFAAGYNHAIQQGSGFFRSFSIFLVMLWQSAAQRTRIFGKEDTLSETMGAFLYDATRTVKAAKGGLEDELGSTTDVIAAENRAGDVFGVAPLSHVQEMVQLQKNPLLTAKEITQMKPTHMIAIVDGFNFYLKKFGAHLNKTLSERSKMKPYLSSENTVQEPKFVRCVREVIGDDAMEQIREGWTPRIISFRDDEDEGGIGGVEPSIDGGGGNYLVIKRAGSMAQAIAFAVKTIAENADEEEESLESALA